MYYGTGASRFAVGSVLARQGAALSAASLESDKVPVWDTIHIKLLGGAEVGVVRKAKGHKGSVFATPTLEAVGAGLRGVEDLNKVERW